ncbi:hypothetical protein HC028_21340 [Planosporangium flavigriseum]|uniref:Hemerythrin HHE cation binding domain-containing protein n=1 Tax=Planosporangium flavigriseum TaxID=373681 RepID=A0A8J3LTZ4_9ACTN|nr:hypothetical protein [Planosporangium flavigriseum]NJC67028.1 hypothetical protein [Planosporangium flavigriseum]GIG76730.1 hypothetical protein Pfl04_51340 [Planosporangium flavigriseum]
MAAEPMAVRQTLTPAERIRRVLRHRAELLAAVQGFQYALTMPVAQPDWRRAVAAELPHLRAAFAAHVELTEGPDGLYAEVLADAPRLVRRVNSLGSEHAAVSAALEALARRVDADPERVRSWGSDLLRALSSHRQRGADLIHEAYATDLGGET